MRAFLKVHHDRGEAPVTIGGTVRTDYGLVFKGDVQDHGYDLVTQFEAPGGITIQLYEPRYTQSASRTAAKKTAAKTSTTKKAVATNAVATRAVATRAVVKKTTAKKTTAKRAR